MSEDEYIQKIYEWLDGFKDPPSKPVGYGWHLYVSKNMGLVKFSRKISKGNEEGGVNFLMNCYGISLEYAVKWYDLDCSGALDEVRAKHGLSLAFGGF